MKVKAAIAAVTTVIAAFSGYIKGIAPPEDGGTALAVGMVALSSVFALLLIQAVSSWRKSMSRGPWLIAAVLLFAVSVGIFFVYAGAVDKSTFSCPGWTDRRVIGKLNPVWDNRIKDDYAGDFCAAVKDIGLDNITQVAIPGSINRVREQLRAFYFVFVLTLLSAIFCLTDGAMGNASVTNTDIGNADQQAS